MKRRNLKAVAVIFGILFLIYGIGQIKFWLWRTEHPEAPAWIFFIPEGKH